MSRAILVSCASFVFCVCVFPLPLAWAGPKDKPTAAAQTCLDGGCHAAVSEHKVMHGPVAQDKCLACHQYQDAGKHTFTLIVAEAELCVRCHTMPNRTTVHQPVRQGRCTGCHDPHGSDQKLLLLSDPTQGLCTTCHQQENFAKMKFKHGPVAAGACILCHEPHSSWQPKLLIDEPANLCQRCHTEVLAPAKDPSQHVHSAMKLGCSQCHDPHASDLRFQLRAAAPDLCLTCHAVMKEKLASAKVMHGALEQADGCLGCHAPHLSPLPALLRDNQKKMCLSCHNQAITTPTGRTLTNMARLLADNPQQHGPIRQDACDACHQPHASDEANLLVKAYPPEFYAPFTEERYALCFGCHRPELVRDPRGVGVTRFRDSAGGGDRNLHYLHVNREKGRTCRACHEVHASRHPFHIRDAVPFGGANWMLEIRFEKTDTGGRCSPGCHETRSYDAGAKS